MLEPLTDIERRQALCRAIFLSSDNDFALIESHYKALQDMRIREKTGVLGIPLHFATDTDNVEAIQREATAKREAAAKKFRGV